MTTTATLAGLSDRTLEQALEQNFSDGTLASAVGIVAEQFGDAVERSMLEEAATRLAQVPALLARGRELEKALASIHAARLRKDGSDHGYGWNITALNRAIDAALPLIGKEAPPLDPRTAHIAENADRVAQHMGCRFTLNKEPTDADR